MKAIDRVTALLRSNGHRMTEQRAVILDVVMSTKGHITPPDILRHVQKRLPSLDASTVYRTLALLEGVGILSHAHLEGGPEYHHVGAHDHVHLECGTCGKDLFLHEDDTIEMKRLLEKRSGFRADFRHFAIAGVCDDCLKKGSGP